KVEKRMGTRTAQIVPARGLESRVVVGIVASDYPALRRLTGALHLPGFEIAAGACELNELVLDARTTFPDVVVLWMAAAPQALPAASSLLRKTLGDVGIVAVTRSMKPRDLRRALDAGVDGIVVESQVQLVLPLTVRNVCAGQLSVPAQARAHVTREAL